MVKASDVELHGLTDWTVYGNAFCSICLDSVSIILFIS